ncbi:MAG: tetratricopeptide repeat protein [bacterium]|nr:tetratricopeptide repeat protein [bacterium]
MNSDKKQLYVLIFLYLFILFVLCCPAWLMGQSPSAGSEGNASNVLRLQSRVQLLETIMEIGAYVLLVIIIGLSAFFIKRWKQDGDSMPQGNDDKKIENNDTAATSATIDEAHSFVTKGELKKIIKDIPSFYKGLPLEGIAKGNEELASGNLKMAEVCFMLEIIKNPELAPANAWVGLAHTYSALKRDDEALEAIKMGIIIDRRDPIFNKLGQISMAKAELLSKLKRFPEAIETIDKEVLVVNSTWKKARELLASCKLEQETITQHRNS